PQKWNIRFISRGFLCAQANPTVTRSPSPRGTGTKFIKSGIQTASWASFRGHAANKMAGNWVNSGLLLPSIFNLNMRRYQFMAECSTWNTSLPFPQRPRQQRDLQRQAPSFEPVVVSLVCGTEERCKVFHVERIWHVALMRSYKCESRRVFHVER